MTDKILKDKFHISADELEHRMQMQVKYHDEPIQQAVGILMSALDRVMKKLGVDVDQDPDVIHDQQDQLGIIVTEETRDEMAGLQGFFVFLKRRLWGNRPENDFTIIPYCWIGAARLNSNGECYVDIQYFQDERLEETGGIKLV